MIFDFMTDFITQLWHFINEISPYLILGFIIAGVLSVFISQDFIEKTLGASSGIKSIFYASLLGIPLPLCSCSVIPVSTSLKNHGASKGAVTSFLLSTPQTGVDSIMLTYGLLGPIVAIIRPIIALVTGLIGGTLVHLIDGRYREDSTPSCKESCCHGQKESTIKKILKYAFITLPKDIARPLIYGIIIGALINILNPFDFLLELTGGDSETVNFTGSILMMLLMIIIGTPIYICATASLPIGWIMYENGVSMGSVIVFLIVGPATNTTSISTMLKILGKKSTIIIFVTLIILSLFFGLLTDYIADYYQYLFKIAADDPHQHNHSASKMTELLSFIFIGIILSAAINPFVTKK